MGIAVPFDGADKSVFKGYGRLPLKELGCEGGIGQKTVDFTFFGSQPAFITKDFALALHELEDFPGEIADADFPA